MKVILSEVLKNVNRNRFKTNVSTEYLKAPEIEPPTLGLVDNCPTN